MASFKERYNITSNWQYFVIVVVFALTGSSSALIAKPLLPLLGITKTSLVYPLYLLLYFLVIFPIYQILLVTLGFLFGQFKFFWQFEKNMLRALKLGFIADFLEKK
jgi:hypothetical protein